MISDKERRKVAANLRDSAGNGEVLRDAFLEEILAGDTGLWFAEDIEIDTLLYHLADLIEPSDVKCRCIDCEYGMVPNCYGVYCRCLARYMEPDGFCSLAKRRADR